MKPANYNRVRNLWYYSCQKWPDFDSDEQMEWHGCPLYGCAPLMTTIVYIFGICCFGKSLEFWIQKSVRNLFAQNYDVIESKQSHPLSTPHSTSAYNPCVNEIKWLEGDCHVIWVSMQQQYISPQTQFSQSVFRVSLLYPILTLLCIFPLLENTSPVFPLFCLAKKIYICILSFVIWTTVFRGISVTKKNCHRLREKLS